MSHAGLSAAPHPSGARNRPTYEGSTVKASERKLKPKDETHRKHTEYVTTSVAEELLREFDEEVKLDDDGPYAGGFSDSRVSPNPESELLQ
ncbi:DUF2250 domain-containing protein [Halorientalis marina]|uniref:DUF2250 domain-containing protein n=1 Tax=Halorientalis marina TaxID=2931976 RepID=UPI001FF3324D|nr:DUF2250 domain-containing protein [Halorientalis marina]